MLPASSKKIKKVKRKIESMLPASSKKDQKIKIEKKEDVGGLKKYKTTNRIKWMGKRIKR